MEIRKLNAARGWLWVKQGGQLIMRNPVMAVMLALAGALVMLAALKVPLLGPLAAVLLMPVCVAAYMRLCRALEEEEKIELAHLFGGFRKQVPGLLVLGGFTLLGILAVSIVMVLIGGETLAKLLGDIQSANDPQILAEAMWAAGSGVAFSLLVGFSLVIALMLSLQYAPMLVLLSGLTPLVALRASLAGSLRNLVPYTVYSLIMQVIALALGMLPFGIGLVVLLPLGFTSLYVSYRNIFPFAGEHAPT